MTEEPKTPQEPEAAGSACSAGLGTCGTCRFKGEELEQQGWFRCDRTRFAGDKYDPAEAGEGAVVEDGSGYHACLRVETDFGCVKWEQA